MRDWNRRGMLALGGSLAVAPHVRAQTPPPAALEAAVAQVRAMLVRGNVPGAGVSVVHQGQLVVAEGLGFASLPFQVPATPDTLFHLGSVSKQMTAALVLELVEAGTVSLDDPLGQHVRGIHRAFAAIPIRTLLNHTSGVADYEGLPGFEPDRAISRDLFLAGAATLPAQFEPGAAWAYSNTGYVLLGYLLADVTGRSYRELAAERLFGRIGLPSARVDDAAAIIPNRAEPYILDEQEVRHAVGMDSGYSGWPDGGVLMSARDTAGWEQALQGGSALSSATVAALTSPTLMNSGRSTGYGAGWFTDRIGGQPVQYHSGSVPGFLTWAWRSPATRTSATVTINIESGPGARFMREACLMLVEAAAPGSTPLSLQPIDDDAPDVTTRTLALLARGDTPLDPDRFTSEIAALIGTGASGAMPPNLGADTTGLEWTLVSRHDEPGGQVRRYRVVRGGAVRHIAVAYAPDGRIWRVRTV